MITKRHHNHLVLVALAGLGLGLAGCDDNTQTAEDEPTTEEVSAASSTFALRCPQVLDADWIGIGGAFTQKNIYVGQTTIFPFIDATTTTLTCAIPNPGTSKIVRELPFEPGQIDANCGGKVTIKGFGTQLAGVPPFGGWLFKTQRLTANATIDRVRNICHLEVPLKPTDVSVKTTLPCRPNSTTNFSCPVNTAPR